MQLYEGFAGAAPTKQGADRRTQSLIANVVSLLISEHCPIRTGPFPDQHRTNRRQTPDRLHPA